MSEMSLDGELSISQKGETGGSGAPSGSTHVHGEQRVFSGKGVALGISMGKARVFLATGSLTESASTKHDGRTVNVEHELKRFRDAVLQAERELDKITELTREKLGDDSAIIFEAQRLMLRDEVVYDAVERSIRRDKLVADRAVAKVLSAHQRRLRARGNDFLRERVSDLADVQDRLHKNLRRDELLQTVEEGSVVFAQKLSAADLILFSQRNIQGVVMGEGGATSHVAIIARSLGLPTIIGARDALAAIEDGASVIVDARRGRVVVHPSTRVEEAYRDQLKAHEERLQQQRHWRHHPATTTDGRQITLQANLEFTQEASLLEDCGAKGIGLFRTEMLLMLSEISSISEEDAYQTYREVVEAADPYPTTLRLLDLGGDKLLPRAHREHNPFLGWRGIRVLLDKPGILRTQLRATLRAAAHGDVQILIPMVTDLQEVRTVHTMIDEVSRTLGEEGIAHGKDVPLGIMVEVPSVALQAELFAQHVDFFSIGTNDLTQYVLAVDRGNDMVASRYSSLHPSVLGLIKRIVTAGREAGVPVSVCGEMAGEPRSVPVLIGLGVEQLSASPAYLPEVKQAVRMISYAESRDLADRLLTCASIDEVEQNLCEWIESHAAYINTLPGSKLVDEVLEP